MTNLMSWVYARNTYVVLWYSSVLFRLCLFDVQLQVQVGSLTKYIY